MKRLLTKSRLLTLSMMILGAAAGYLYYHFIGCQSGACPIWSNPFISTGYGALLGILLAGMFPAKKADPSRDLTENSTPNTTKLKG